MAELNPKLVLGTFSSRRFKVQTLMFVHSLRQFGGELANLPIWIFVPEGKELDSETQAALKDLGVTFHSFSIDEPLLRFPFAAKAIAAAAAEMLAEQEGCTLAWHDRTGMIRQAPTAFYLPEGKTFGFRPTDVANIGAPYDKPLPTFWQDICNHFGLSANNLPPITTVLDQQELHLYINAGLLVVRPEKGILRAWAKNLLQIYNLPIFSQFYKENQTYAIFMHQAALTAAVVLNTAPEERVILPDDYLFSVDNFFDYPPDSRPKSLDEIVTGRFHDFFALDNWESLITASDDLVGWFKEQLSAGPYWPVSSE